MKFKLGIIIIGLFVLTICFLFLNLYGYNIINNLSYNSSINSSITITPSLSIDRNNSSLTFPPNDFAINHINWSSYPNLTTGYVYTVYIAGPNDVIPYKFIEVQICTEVKDTENRTIIEEQLAGVAKEAKKIYGPPSSINIIGTKGGVAMWFASILPYEEKVYF
ncbi:hypothetical protein [Methanocella conradii]|uniref:hypothetical protein n=1 Tax=Methanocella conradii TaxID=1175444 RepID=UPI0024B35BCD|nr:hypothetical protein [Methanocella conradii]MDI6898125.1 hypothetical protein [Methanocella conradii]